MRLSEAQNLTEEEKEIITKICKLFKAQKLEECKYWGVKMAEDQSLFGDLDEFTVWKKEWKGMPAFVQNELVPFREIIVRFEKQEDVDDFCKLINQKVTTLTSFIWHPEMTIDKVANLRYVDKPVANPVEKPVTKPEQEEDEGW